MQPCIIHILSLDAHLTTFVELRSVRLLWSYFHFILVYFLAQIGAQHEDSSGVVRYELSFPSHFFGRGNVWNEFGWLMLPFKTVKK